MNLGNGYTAIFNDKPITVRWEYVLMLKSRRIGGQAQYRSYEDAVEGARKAMKDHQKNQRTTHKSVKRDWQ